MKLRAWRGGLYENPGGPLAVKCVDCGAEPASLCMDMVDKAVKSQPHTIRTEAAGYRGSLVINDGVLWCEIAI